MRLWSPSWALPEQERCSGTSWCCYRPWQKHCTTDCWYWHNDYIWPSLTGTGETWSNSVPYVGWQEHIQRLVSRPGEWVSQRSRQLSQKSEPSIFTPSQLEGPNLHPWTTCWHSWQCHFHTGNSGYWVILFIAFIRTQCHHTCYCRYWTEWLPLLRDWWPWQLPWCGKQ